MILRYAIGVGLALVLGVPAFAGPASERVFSREALARVSVDQQVIYTHSREGASQDQLNPITNGEIRIRVQEAESGGSEAIVTMGETGKLKPVSSWPVSSGNPIVPIFLESALRTMSRVTGGSTFYIRNRIKEALSSGGTIQEVELSVGDQTVAAQEIVFEPFAKDKNRDRMGPFAEMKLVFVVSEDLPGDIVSFRAETDGAAYSEKINFARVDQGS